jgi:hypothetical protein
MKKTILVVLAALLCAAALAGCKSEKPMYGLLERAGGGGYNVVILSAFDWDNKSDEEKYALAEEIIEECRPRAASERGDWYIHAREQGYFDDITGPPYRCFVYRSANDDGDTRAAIELDVYLGTFADAEAAFEAAYGRTWQEVLEEEEGEGPNKVTVRVTIPDSESDDPS